MKQREWDVVTNAVTLVPQFDGAGFGRASAMVTLVQDAEGPGLGSIPFRLNRLIGSLSFVGDSGDVDPANQQSPGLWGVISMGLVVADADLNDAPTTADIHSSDDADMEWLWRESYSLRWWDGRFASGNLFCGTTAYGIADSWYERDPTQSALSATVAVSTTPRLMVDWPIRGGKGTTLKKDRAVYLTFGFLSFATFAQLADLQGVGWDIGIGYHFKLLGTSY